MACGCSKARADKAKVAYEVKYRDGRKERFDAPGLAQAAARKGNGSLRVVAA